MPQHVGDLYPLVLHAIKVSDPSDGTHPGIWASPRGPERPRISCHQLHCRIAAPHGSGSACQLLALFVLPYSDGVSKVQVSECDGFLFL